MTSRTGHMPLSYTSTLPAFSNMSHLAASAEVPFQPGNIINFSYAQKNMRFPRVSTLEMGNGYQMNRSQTMSQAREMGTSRKNLRPGWSNVGGMRAWTAPNSFSNDVQGSRVMATRRSTVSYLDQPPKLPAFVLVDKVVLRFRCWMKDDMALLTGPDRVIIHNCILNYNLIDDSFTIMEPRQENSGLNQGCILRRQRLQKPDGEGVYTWKDLEIGGQIVVRGQVLHFVDCDEYTRKWYEQQGVVLGPALQAPMDPNEVRENRERKKRRDYEMAKQRRIQSEMMHVEEVKHRFLTYDRKVLRFYAIWDDRNSIFGGKHFITLRYYLFDYTIDMQERHGSADGQKTRFLMRQRIPTNSNQPLTHEEQRTGKTGFITLDDLFIGARIDVFGKTLFIYDADEFTKRYFSSTLGKGMQSIDISEPSVPIPRLPTPPSNGLGAEDDSIQNCKMLRPKPLYRDMAKYKKFAGKVMRFTARWDSERPEESSRSFIISFFPADDTVSIWETSGDGRNTGMASGKFLERMKLYKPGTSGTKLKYYVQSDFYINATVVAQGRKFVLTTMDEFTARLMDSDDTGQKKKKVELLKECRIKDKNHTGVLVVEDFMEVIRGKLYAMTNSDLMDLMTLCQRDSRDFSGVVHYQEFFDRIFAGLAAEEGRQQSKMRNREALRQTSEESSTVRLPPVVDNAKVNNPATRETVQWADHQNSRDFGMPASDGQWQMGDLDAQDRVMAQDEDGANIDWASGNQFFD